MILLHCMRKKVARVAFAVAAAISTAGCAFSRPIEQQHPSVQAATPTSDDSSEDRRATALHTAASDLGCARVDVVLTLERRYANTAAPRYVIEGCGKRATYAETCEDYPRCRYLVLSIVPVPAASSAPPPAPLPSAPAPGPAHDL